MTTHDELKWNAHEWLESFRRASRERKGIRELRTAVYESTVRIVGARRYVCGQDSIVQFPEPSLDAMHAGTVLYESTDTVALSRPPTLQLNALSVINGDCLEAAAALVSEGYRPAVLNMANRQNPGGGVHTGAGAQEENIFRRSTLFYSLYQFAPYAESYGVPAAPGGSAYPLSRESGAVYSPRVLVFRSSEETGYGLLPRPYELAVLTVSAIPGPDLEPTRGPEPRLTPRMVAGTLPKIRAMLRMGGHHGHDALVLSAFGCGAFGNPPAHMAELFRDVLAEPEFKNQFARIVFAILDDHNAGRSHNPDGNFRPFRRVLIE